MHYAFKPNSELFNFSRLAAQLNAAPDARVPLLKQALGLIDQRLNQAYYDGADIRDLVYGRAWAVDQILHLVWQLFPWPQPSPALIAVGGYGRGELHPRSDLDLLILVPDSSSAANARVLQKLASEFITLLWDIKLEVGHSFRTLEECIKEAQKDLNTATNLFESRFLIGTENLFKHLQAELNQPQLWPAAQFFSAKLAEQNQRHARFNSSEHNLEPNIKTSPGGLRDIQLIGWVAQRHFQSADFTDLVQAGFLTASELRLLEQGQSYLWLVRYGLHLLNEHCEDRLLFEHQRQLAVLFGYLDTSKRLAVEQFMKRYYRVVTSLTELNEMLLQYFDQLLISPAQPETLVPLNERFQIRAGLIEHSYADVFTQTPEALIEIFVLMAQNPSIQGVRATTIRALRDNRHLIDAAFRQNAQVKQLFLTLLNSNNDVPLQLTRMSRYGILGRFVPDFGHAVGLTQHDLFHIYTVETHTLKLLQQIQLFRQPEAQASFPVSSSVVHQLPNLAVLWLAGLFHDLGKGRGGDHSELGAVAAQEFCQQLGLSGHETKLVSWLVAQHLVMSVTAQKQDLTDPEVIKQFARLVGQQEYLDYLHVLTVADINATNPKLWNSWRAALLNQLYSSTKRALALGLEHHPDMEQEQAEKQESAAQKLEQLGVSRVEAYRLWEQLGQDYFLNTSAVEIAWHSQAILAHGQSNQPLVLVQAPPEQASEGGTKIFIYAPDVAFSFAATAAVLDRLHLSIHDARIASSDSGFTLNSWVVLEPDGAIPSAPQRLAEIQRELQAALYNTAAFPKLVERHTSQYLRYFAQPTQVFIHNDTNNQRTVIEVRTPDRPGLLARIGRVFMEFNLWLQQAKIATLGTRVEDVFFVTQQDGTPLTDAKVREQLKRRICDELDAQAHKL